METHSIGDAYKFKPGSHELIIKEANQWRTVKLEPLISDLLLAFVLSPDEVILRAQLIDKLWQGNFEVGDPALTKTIFKLRRLFGQNGKAMFETVSKQGYRFNTEIGAIKAKNKSTSFLGHSTYKNLLVLLLLIILLVIIALIIDPKLLHKISH